MYRQAISSGQVSRRRKLVTESRPLRYSSRAYNRNSVKSLLYLFLRANLRRWSVKTCDALCSHAVIARFYPFETAGMHAASEACSC